MRLLQASFLFILTLSLSACQQSIETSGTFLSKSESEQLKPGLSQENLEERLGPPSYQSALDPNFIAYIGTRLQIRSLQSPRPIERRIIALDMTGGRIQSVVEVSLRDGRRIYPNQNRTPTNGRTISLIEELVGNIGRF